MKLKITKKCCLYLGVINGRTLTLKTNKYLQRTLSQPFFVMLTLHFQMRDSEIVVILSTFSFHKEDKCNLNGLVWACAALYFRTHGNEGRLFVILHKSDLSCQQLTESQNQICVSLCFSTPLPTSIQIMKAVCMSALIVTEHW